MMLPFLFSPRFHVAEDIKKRKETETKEEELRSQMEEEGKKLKK
jgi:hypothetical protein